MLLLLHLDKEQPTCPKFQQTGLYILDLKCHIRTEVNKVLASAFPSQDKDSIASSLKFNISSKYIYIYNKFSLLLPYICLHCKSFPFILLYYSAPISVFMQEKVVLTTCLYSLGSAPRIQHIEADIVEATQPPSVDAIQKFNFYAVVRCQL